MRQALVLMFLVLAASFVTGCATPQSDNISSIPWNRPQQWEGQGALGGMGGPQGSY